MRGYCIDLSGGTGMCWSGLGRGAAKIEGQLGFFEVLDLAVGGFEAGDVLCQGFHKAFGVLGGEDEPGFHLAFWRTGHDVYKVDDKFGVRVGDDHQVSILAFGHLLADLNIQLGIGGRLIGH